MTMFKSELPHNSTTTAFRLRELIKGYTEKAAIQVHLSSPEFDSVGSNLTENFFERIFEKDNLCDVTRAVYAAANAATKSALGLSEFIKTVQELQFTQDSTLLKARAELLAATLAATDEAESQFKTADENYIKANAGRDQSLTDIPEIYVQKGCCRAWCASMRSDTEQFYVRSRIALDINQAATNCLEKVNRAVGSFLEVFASPNTRAALENKTESSQDKIFLSDLMNSHKQVSADLKRFKSALVLAQGRADESAQSTAFWNFDPELMDVCEIVAAPDAPKKTPRQSFGFWAACGVAAVTAVATAYHYLNRP